MTLSETAQLTKKILLYGGIVIIVLLALWAGIAYYLATRPVEVYVELPTKGFGLLPKPALPKTKLTSTNVTYELDTETGSLPTGFPELIKVYFIPKLGTTFSAPQRAKSTATAFSFPNGPQILSPTIYKFTDNKGGEMIYDLDSTNFRFKRPIATVSAEFTDTENPNLEVESLLVNNFKKYLNDQGVLAASLSNGRTTVFYDQPRSLDASEAAVTIWQEDIVEGEEENQVRFPIVTPDYKEGLVRGVVTKYQSLVNKYLSIDFIYWPIDTTRFETYPVKPVTQAFEELESGQGITVVPYSRSTVAIEKVYLAYLLPKEYTPYLQPVYVFEGADFAAYVPAIPAENFEP